MNRERALKVLLVFLGVLFSALAYPLVALWQPNQADALQMLLSVYVTLGIFLLLAARNPSRESHFDRFHRMVEFCSRRCHGGAGIADRERTHTSPDRRGCACDHWCSLARASSSQAVRGAGIHSQHIGSHSDPVMSALLDSDGFHSLHWKTAGLLPSS